MDLLFKRYASPFLLLDEMILADKLSEFVSHIVDETNHEQEWEFFLHKVFDKSFREFKESLRTIERPREMSKLDIETTIKDSLDITQNFVPDEGGEWINGII